jgi:chemotaxis receptor (MCP) glutamine deamidase CheD
MALPTIDVPPDHFDVRVEDGLLSAALSGSVAVCLYDAVEEQGGLVHLRLMTARHGGDGPLGDLLLLEACLKRLREVAPQAKHWQARVLAHLGADGSLRSTAEAVQQSLEQFCADSRIRLVGAEQRFGLACTLQFRPAMGQYRLDR